MDVSGALCRPWRSGGRNDGSRLLVEIVMNYPLRPDNIPFGLRREQGRLLRGWALAMQGHPAEGVVQIRQALPRTQTWNQGCTSPIPSASGEPHAVQNWQMVPGRPTSASLRSGMDQSSPRYFIVGRYGSAICGDIVITAKLPYPTVEPISQFGTACT
jgi:hypothetical protein